MSYIFGGNTGLSYEDIQRRRQVADQLTSANARTPQNQWEGLHSIGRAIAARMIDRRASAAEEEGRSANSELMARIFGGMGGAATPATYSGGGQQGAPTFPDATPPATFTGPETAQDGTVMAFAASPAVASTSDAIGLPASLIQSESGGNFQAQNDVMGAGGQGHFGRGQFSRARLQDAMNAGVIPQGTTPEQFKASPAMQISVENWHRNDIMSRAEADGLMGYVGQDLNGDAPGGVVTPQGMLAVAHLGGYGGLNRFLKTGGAYNPSDAFGTSLFDYLDMHAGGGPAQPAAGGGGAQPQATPVQAQAAPQAGPDLGLMIEALNSPYTSEGHRMVIAQLIERQLSGGEQMSPYQRAQLGLAQSAEARAQALFERDINAEPESVIAPLEARAAAAGLQPGTAEYQTFMLNNGAMPEQPNDPASVREYQFAVGQGYQGTYEQWLNSRPSRNSTNVTVNNGGEVGTIPQGYELFTDPDTGARSMRPIAGGPEDTSRQDAARAESEAATANLQVEEIGRALAILENGGLPASGAVGSALSVIPGTEAADLSALLDTIGANISFEYLNQMRQQSPTGGALGNVTERELDLLRATAGNLSLDQSPSQLAQNLRRLEEQFGRIVHGPEWSASQTTERQAGQSDEDLMEMYR